MKQWWHEFWDDGVVKQSLKELIKILMFLYVGYRCGQGRWV